MFFYLYNKYFLNIGNRKTGTKTPEKSARKVHAYNASKLDIRFKPGLIVSRDGCSLAVTFLLFFGRYPSQNFFKVHKYKMRIFKL